MVLGGAVCRKLGFASPDWADQGRMLIGLIVASSLAGAAWAWWDRHRQDPWQRLLGRMRDELATLQIDAPTHLCPRAMAERVRWRWGAVGAAVAGGLDMLNQARCSRAGWRAPDPA